VPANESNGTILFFPERRAATIAMRSTPDYLLVNLVNLCKVPEAQL
jgi:hypothetical protein